MVIVRLIDLKSTTIIRVLIKKCELDWTRVTIKWRCKLSWRVIK